MKICFINNVYTSEIRGGAERTIKTLAQFLESRGHNVCVIERNHFYKQFISWPLWRRFLHHALSFLNLCAYFELKNKIKSGNFDLVWSHNLTGFGLLSLTALGNGKKIHTFHDIQYLHPSGLLIKGHESMLDTVTAQVYQMIGRFLFPKDSLVIFPSAWLASLYKNYKFAQNNKHLVLKNPLEPIKPVTHNSDSNFNFLYLGQIEEHKGITLLLNAFTQIDNQAIRLVVAGTGSLLKSLEQDTKDTRISFRGPYENPYTELAKADCLVIPSICYENLPTVALEAALANVPVIASNLGGLAEIINEDNLLFDPCVVNIKEKMEWALANPKLLEEKASDGRAKLAILDVEKYLQIVGENTGVIF